MQVAAISEDEPQRFIDGVARSKQYIVDGDVFQVNLSRGWDVALAAGAAADVYAALRVANPAPFSAYLDLGEAGQIISSSPERLVQVKDGVVQTRPIAGTFARSLDPIEDAVAKLQRPIVQAECVGNNTVNEPH